MEPDLLAEELVKSQPEPTPTADRPAGTDAAPEPVDKYGRSFDRSLHRANPDGSPRLTKSGELWPIGGRGTKPPLTKATPEKPLQSIVPPPPGSSPPQDAGVAGAEDHKAIAELTVDSIVATLAIALGPNWSCRNTAERGQLVSAWEAYYRKKGITEMSPEGMLALVMTGYTAPRLYASERVQGWLAKRRGEDAHADSGANGVGQDATRPSTH